MVMERLDATAMHPENQDPTKQFAIRHAKELLVDAGVKDPGEKIETITLAQAPVETSGIVIMPKLELPKQPLDPEDILKLQQAIEEYKKGPPTPESVTNYWRAKLHVDGAKVGINIVVPDCDWTEKEVQKSMVDVKGNPVSSMMVYKPEQIRGEKGLILLGEMYPSMAKVNTPITDTHESIGWIKVEATIDAPNRDTSQIDLEDFARKQEYLGQRGGVYILASQASKDLTGQYLDQGGTSSRLLGTHFRDSVVDVNGHSGGYLGLGRALNSQDHNPYLGGRFEQVKKA